MQYASAVAHHTTSSTLDILSVISNGTEVKQSEERLSLSEAIQSDIMKQYKLVAPSL